MMTDIRVAFSELVALRRAHTLRSELSASLAHRDLAAPVELEAGAGCRSLRQLCGRLALRLEELAAVHADLGVTLDRSLQRYTALESS